MSERKILKCCLSIGATLYMPHAVGEQPFIPIINRGEREDSEHSSSIFLKIFFTKEFVLFMLATLRKKRNLV